MYTIGNLQFTNPTFRGKNKKLSLLTKEIFHEINVLATVLDLYLVKTLVSRNFCHKSVRVQYHSVEIARNLSHQLIFRETVFQKKIQKLSSKMLFFTYY